MNESHSSNYEVFRDCLSAIVIGRSMQQPSKSSKRRGLKGRKKSKAIQKDDEPTYGHCGNDDPADLADFIEVATTPNVYALIASLSLIVSSIGIFFISSSRIPINILPLPQERFNVVGDILGTPLHVDG